MKSFRRAIKGFTLIEMLLVMAVIAAIVVGIATYSQQKMSQLRQDRAVLQIQQILNAGLAFYLNNTTWPTSMADDLQGDGTVALPGGYLPGPSNLVKIVSPWAGKYYIGHTTSTNAPNALFAVCTTIDAGTATPTIAQILAGRLPMAYVVEGDHAADCDAKEGTGVIPLASECKEAPCTLVTTVNVPGQNLNNARSVNFAGVYHHGACVAAPKCPAKMVPTIIVAPTSVSGMNDDPNTIYPISSFTAYVSNKSPSTNPVTSCPNDSAAGTQACPDGGVNDKYWRVCLQIITTKGQVVYNKGTSNSTSTGYAATTIMALTRCMPQGEDTEETVSGSNFNVFSY
jgi:prepilin-type N-terminal cleavage/methylation domain-containing protein